MFGALRGSSGPPLVSFVLYILTPRFALERAVEHEKFILTVGSPLPSRVGRKDHPGSRGTARYNTECLIWTARHKGPGKTSDKASATSLAPAVRAKSASGRGLRAHARGAGQVRKTGQRAPVWDRERAAAAGFLGQERRADQARGAGAASRWQRRGTRSSGRAAGGSVDFASFTLSRSPAFRES